MKKMMYFAAALLVLVGCQKKDNSIENTPKEVVTIKGSIELPQTPNKIAAPTGWESATEEFYMLWQAEDKIYIYNGLGECSLFTIASGAGDNEASFNGSPLSSMESYNVAYGYDPSLDYKGEATYPTYPVPYIEGNYCPFAEGLGTTDGFSIDNFGPVIGLQLKGEDVTLSKIEVVLRGSSNEVLGVFTMPFEDGLALNNTTATKVYFPLKNIPAEKLKIMFYQKNAGVETLIMVKTVFSENMPDENKVNNYPELKVENIQPVSWTKALTLGKNTATSIDIETGVDVGTYTEDANHKPLNDDKTLWEYLDGNTLRILTPASQINSNLGWMFSEYTITTVLGVGYIHATNAKSMFEDCKSLVSIDFTDFNTKDITTMESMFKNCYALTSLDLSGFNMEKVESTESMFNSCTSLKSLILSNNFKLVAEIREDMFHECGPVDGKCTVYGITDADVKSELTSDTGWFNNARMRFDGE